MGVNSRHSLAAWLVFLKQVKMFSSRGLRESSRLERCIFLFTNWACMSMYDSSSQRTRYKTLIGPLQRPPEEGVRPTEETKTSPLCAPALS